MDILTNILDLLTSWVLFWVGVGLVSLVLIARWMFEDAGIFLTKTDRERGEAQRRAEVQERIDEQRAEDEAVHARQLERERDRYQATLYEYERLLPASRLIPIGVPGFLPAPGEQVYLPMEAQLFEWRKSAGHYAGGMGLRGVSLRVPGTESARAYWGGLSRSHWVEGEEGWSPIDQGTAIVTSGRIAFRGVQGFIEWSYPKLVGLEIDPNLNAMALQVSHRRKGHILIVEDVLFFLFKLEAAFARSRGGSVLGPDRPELTDELAGEYLEGKAGLIPQVIEGIKEEKQEAYLDRTKIEELDELLRDFEAIQARTWEPPLELLADEEEWSSPPPASDPPTNEARGQLPPPSGGRLAWTPDDVDAARHVWSNLDANTRALFNLMLTSDGPVAWDELASLLGPAARDDTVFGTFGHSAKLAKEVGKRHVVITTHSERGSEYMLDPVVRALFLSVRT